MQRRESESSSQPSLFAARPSKRECQSLSNLLTDSTRASHEYITISMPWFGGDTQKPHIHVFTSHPVVIARPGLVVICVQGIVAVLLVLVTLKVF
jgi:hypothetical protein